VNTHTIRRTALTAAVLAWPRLAAACPICFGENDSAMTLGVSYGIYFMLGIIAVLWVAFGSFFIYLWWRSRRSGLFSEHAKADGPHVHQEGTV